MTDAAAADWVARGRTHQWQGRPVDAMLCFRRAVREAPQAFDARFHLGEVLWQLGRLPDAIASWREAIERAPDHPAAQMALAEALLGTGDFAGAGAVAARYVEMHPRNVRAQAIAAVAALVQAPGGAAVQAIADAVASAPELLVVPSIAGTLAQALASLADAGQRDRIVDAIIALPGDASRMAAMPALLLALCCERTAGVPASASVSCAEWLAAAVARPWTAADHDALRRVARVAVTMGSPHAAALTSGYAVLCNRAAGAPGPLAWPRRTRGTRLRILVIVDRAEPAGQSGAVLAQVGALPADRFESTTVVIGTTTLPDPGAHVHFDPDVAIDLAGLCAPAGPLLAQRPARLRIAVAAVPMHNVPPLVDRVAADADELIALLQSLRTALPPSAPAMRESAAMAELWKSAVAAHQRNDAVAAIARYEEVLALQPEFAPAHYLLGNAMRESGKLAAARDHFAAALACAPDYVEARVAAIRAAVDAHATKDAEALAQEGANLDGEASPSLLRAWGSARLAAGDGAGAATLFEAALAREPIDGETHYNHGVALQMDRRNADAARAYQRALTFRPDLIAADFNLGVIFSEEGNRAAAIHAYSHVIERDPEHVAAYRNLGEALFAAGRLNEWRANFARFEARCPGSLPLAVHALEVAQYSGDFQRVEHYLEGLRKERYRAADEKELVDSLEELLYLLLFFDVEPELVARFAQTYDDAARRVYGEPMAPPGARRAGRLRIGYLSADLRNHVMGKMIWQAVQHHDRARFELRFYSLSNERDAWTGQFTGIADGFSVLAGMTDTAAARAIREDDVDLLVDLSTHTKGARPGILAQKPARVQVTHVASAGTLGLSAIDFKLTDRFSDVEQNPPARSETLLPMEGCVYPYRHVEPAREHVYRREAFGLAHGAIVIGAFVTGLKLSRRCLSLWREVLARIPAARLAFSPLNPAWTDVYLRLAAAGGIAADRLAFIPQGADDAHNQARYHLIDFVLDPMPYGGVNGTLEALDMGVPVVTLVGARHAERTSYSILTNLGVTQTIAQSGKEYVAIAARLAVDPEFAQTIRASIRERLADSALTDMRAHTRHLEDAYVEALRLRAPDVLADMR